MRADSGRDDAAVRPFAFGVLGGYGAVGRVVASELARTGLGTLVIAGRDLPKAAALAAALPGASAARVDALDDRALAELCARCRVIVNCAGPVRDIGARVAVAAVRAGCHYVDPGGFDVVLRAVGAHLPPGAETRAVVSAGWIPGLSELLCRHADALAEREFASPGVLRVYMGDASDWSETGFRDIVWHASRYLAARTGYYAGGRWRLPSPLALMRTARLPPPVGKTRAYLYANPELDSLGRSRAAGVAGYVAGYRPTAVLRLVAAAAFPAGLDRHAARLVRRGFRDTRRAGARHGFVVVAVDGVRDGAQHTLTVSVIDDRHYWLTGLVPALVAAMLARGDPVAPGASYLADAVDPAAFVARAAAAGVRCAVAVEPHAAGGGGE